MQNPDSYSGRIVPLVRWYLPFRRWMIPILMVLLPVVVSCAVLYPGCPGMEWGLFNCKHLYIYNWFPPLSTFTWGVLENLFPNLEPEYFSILCFTVLLFWVGVVLVSSAMIRSNIKAFVCAAVMGTYPPVFQMLEVIGKDSLLMASMLMSYGLLFWAEQKHSKLSLWLGLASLIFAMGIRYNGFFAAIPLFIWAGFVVVDEYKACGQIRHISKTVSSCLIGIALAAVGLLCVSTINNLITSRNGYPVQQLPLLDLVNISVMTNHNYVPFLRGLYPAQSSHPYGLNDLRQMYQANGNDRIYVRFPGDSPTRPMFQATWDPNEYKSLVASWVAVIIREPVAYLIHRFRVAMSIWFAAAGGPDRNYGCSQLGVTPIHSWGSLACQKILYQPYLYLLIAGVGVILLLTKVPLQYYRAHLAIAASSLFYAAMYFFVAICYAGDRFLWWSMAAAVVLCMQLLIDIKWKSIAIQLANHGRNLAKSLQGRHIRG